MTNKIIIIFDEISLQADGSTFLYLLARDPKKLVGQNGVKGERKEFI